MLAIDGDSHFVEPLDLFERYIDPRFRDRAYKMERDPPSGRLRLMVDNKPLRLLDTEELLSAITGYGQTEDRLRAQSAGFDYHFVKPVNIESLLKLLSSVMAGQASGIGENR